MSPNYWKEKGQESFTAPGGTLNYRISGKRAHGSKEFLTHFNRVLIYIVECNSDGEGS